MKIYREIYSACQNNDNSLFEKIRSKYILKKLFENLNEKKMLQIVKYNKIIQDKLNLDINNYMRYSQIEIELILSKKKI